MDVEYFTSVEEIDAIDIIQTTVAVPVRRVAAELVITIQIKPVEVSVDITKVCVNSVFQFETLSTVRNNRRLTW